MQNWITFSVPGSDNFKEQTAHGRILIILLSVKVSLLSQDLNNFWREMSKLLLLVRPSRHQIPCNLGEDFLSHIVLNCKNKRIVKLPHAAMKLKDTCSLEGRSDKPRKHIRKWDITLLTKVHIIKAMVFPVVTYGCDSWTIKMAEHLRIGAFKLWCWRRLLRVPWTARRFYQSILKEISPKYLLEGLILKLKLQYFGHRCKEPTHWKRPWCWERLKAGGEGDDRGWDGWMASLTQWTWVWVNSRSRWWTGRPGVLQSMGSQIVRHDWGTELKWTAQVLVFG